MRLILRILLLQVDQLSSSDWLFKLDILEHVLKLYTLAVFIWSGGGGGGVKVNTARQMSDKRQEGEELYLYQLKFAQ